MIKDPENKRKRGKVYGGLLLFFRISIPWSVDSIAFGHVTKQYMMHIVEDLLASLRPRSRERERETERKEEEQEGKSLNTLLKGTPPMAYIPSLMSHLEKVPIPLGNHTIFHGPSL